MSAAPVVYSQPAYPQALPLYVLPFVWAVGAELPTPQPASHNLRSVPSNMAAYRRYTEAILQRYVRMSMEAGKVPSLLGQEMFRGKVTSYRVGNFDDVVIFVHDVGRCLHRLNQSHQELISRLALQQFTVGETAQLLGLPHRTVIRRYSMAINRLTKVFLDAGMLEPLKSCQGGPM